MFVTLKKYIQIYLIQIKNNWVREVVYRTNFITNIVVDLVWLGVEFLLFTVIYANTPTLAGWSQQQVYFFLGVLFSSDALFTIFFTRNFWMFSDLVNKGELDILLTKPVNPLFLALTRWMNLTAVSNFVLGVLIMKRYAHTAGFEVGVGYWRVWGLVPLWLCIGLASAFLMRFIFSIWVFWTERSWALARMYYQFFGFATKPDGIYPKTVRYIVLTVLPFAFIGSVPARALLGQLPIWGYAGVFTILSLFFVADVALWRRGILRYQSASS